MEWEISEVIIEWSWQSVSWQRVAEVDTHQSCRSLGAAMRMSSAFRTEGTMITGRHRLHSSQLNQALYSTKFLAYRGKGQFCYRCLSFDSTQEVCPPPQLHSIRWFKTRWEVAEGMTTSIRTWGAGKVQAMHFDRRCVALNTCAQGVAVNTNKRRMWSPVHQIELNTPERKIKGLEQELYQNERHYLVLILQLNYYMNQFGSTQISNKGGINFKKGLKE